jgi:hypothetical protein
MKKKPSDYYFRVFDYDKSMCRPSMFLVEKKFYKKHKHLDDQERGDNVDLPDGFENAMESIWEFEMTPDEAREVMNEAGFTENNKLCEDCI